MIAADNLDIAEVMPPVHPGEILREDWMKPAGLTAYGLARSLGVERTRLERIVRCRQPVTADTALRLARYFGTSAELWTGLQAQYDIAVARQTHGAEIDRAVVPRADRAA